MNLTVSRKARPDISEKPRPLTPCELDLLRQDMNDSYQLLQALRRQSPSSSGQTTGA